MRSYFQKNDIVTCMLLNNGIRGDLRWANGLVVIYLLHGTAKISRELNDFLLSKEDFIVINPGEYYQIHSGSDVSLFLINIETSGLNRLAMGSIPEFDCCSARTDLNRDLYFEKIRTIVASLFELGYKNEPSAHCLVRSRVCSLLDVLTRQFSSSPSQGSTPNTGQRPIQKFQKVLHDISENY
jgi:hypothetical protein